MLLSIYLAAAAMTGGSRSQGVGPPQLKATRFAEVLKDMGARIEMNPTNITV